ncbi:hypothetical protein V8F44DRAFT_596231 [Aspergillus fumigatus]
MESSTFRSQPLYILVGSEQTWLSIHLVVIEHFLQSLREQLDIHQRLQGKETIVMKNIGLHTFALYYKYIYTGNYLISEAVITSQNSSQILLRLQEANSQDFNRPFAVIVLKYTRERRTLLPILFIHSRIYIQADKHK